MKYPLSPAALAQHVAFLGKTGAGKTVSAKGAVEQLVRAGARVCILDPIKSDWWGLTSMADGKRPGFAFHILGGPRGHVPLHPSAGKAVGELVGRGDLPLSVIDMADFPMGGLQAFFTEFGASLMRSMRGVLHLVLEEAHEFAPKERSGVGNENMAVYQAKKLATAGRSKGIRLLLVTQRTQSLHNALLGSCDTMVAHRLTAPADQAPVKEWLKAHFDKATLERVGGSLASLRTGTAWVCSGESAAGTEMVTFPPLTTFDNSATPTSQDGAQHVTTASVDTGRLAEILGDAVTEAEANDPKKLKARIRELEAELARKPAPIIDRAAIDREVAQALEDGFTSGFNAAQNDAIAAIKALPGRTSPPSAGVAHRPEPLTSPLAPQATRPAPAPPRTPRADSIGDGLKPALQRVVNAIGWWRQIGHDPVERDRACVVAGLSPKASTFGVYVAELIKRGLVEVSPGRVGLTPAGAALAIVPAGETRQQIHDIARGLLGQQERRVFDVVYAAHPREIARVGIADQIGLSATASTLGVYISRIAQFGIIENASPGHVRAAGWLFP